MIFDCAILSSGITISQTFKLLVFTSVKLIAFFKLTALLAILIFEEPDNVSCLLLKSFPKFMILFCAILLLGITISQTFKLLVFTFVKLILFFKETTSFVISIFEEPAKLPASASKVHLVLLLS